MNSTKKIILTEPEHLAIESDGDVYVSDRKSNTISVFKPVG
jgi:DNA-binding beta-propeller fold protein YncE